VPEGGAKVALSAADSSNRREERLTELGQAFRRAYRSLRRLRGRDTHLLGGEISHAQFELLAELRERGALAAGELAQVAGLSAATVSQMLDHLETDGHVKRLRSETDRRVVLIELTALGRRRVETTKALWRERWVAALRGLDDEELRIASGVLQRIGAVFEEPTGD
jgi:MarR family transcriptional regulator, organic hydroperoxide resistance regulator